MSARHVHVETEQVVRVVPTLYPGEALEGRGRVGAADALLALVADEADVGRGVAPSESAVVRPRRPGLVLRALLGALYMAAMFTISFAPRWPNAVASAGTRAIAPPRTRSWTAAIGAVAVSRCSRIVSAPRRRSPSTSMFVPAP